MNVKEEPPGVWVSWDLKVKGVGVLRFKQVRKMLYGHFFFFFFFMNRELETTVGQELGYVGFPHVFMI